MPKLSDESISLLYSDSIVRILITLHLVKDLYVLSCSLWQVLLTVSNDPIGVRYQWRQSTTERLFHQAMGVSARVHVCRQRTRFVH